MIEYQIFSANEWVYPDSVLSKKGGSASLISARGADDCFQILTDCFLTGKERITAHFALEGCEAVVYRLLPVQVPANSDREIFTTDNYEEVKGFVTRRAPFEVYELTAPLDAKIEEQGRAAFFVRVKVSPDAPVGRFSCELSILIDGDALTVPIAMTLCQTKVPPLSDAAFHMENWIRYEQIEKSYGAKKGSSRYMEILGNYMDQQLDMRSDVLLLPKGEPITDENGRVTDFDFSFAEAVGNLALGKGYRLICGGFCVCWRHWEREDTALLWDTKVDACAEEGQRQLVLYFQRAWACVQRNGWQKRYMQCLMDEPQFACAENYCRISALCRAYMPSVIIHDPVETTDLHGAIDSWVVKQTIYEKYVEEFRAVQARGEEMWIYTCGFPAGKTMNRIVDLPIAASRLPMWMCYLYGMQGFLHWGYMLHNEEGRRNTCFVVARGLNPAGNSFIVYLGDCRPYESVRAHAQRMGAVDFELLTLLGARDKEKALSIVRAVCRTFDDYESDALTLDRVRRDLLTALS